MLEIRAYVHLSMSRNMTTGVRYYPRFPKTRALKLHNQLRPTMRICWSKLYLKFKIPNAFVVLTSSCISTLSIKRSLKISFGTVVNGFENWLADRRQKYLSCIPIIPRNKCELAFDSVIILKFSIQNLPGDIYIKIIHRKSGWIKCLN